MVYDGFISYSHAADDRLAPALQRGLQRLAKPWNSRRALRIFRDETGLATNPDLWSAIERALDDSEWFVLLASPEAAQSEWVNREIAHWLATKPVDRLLPVVTEGSWIWDASGGEFTPDSTAVPVALRGAIRDEPRHLELRWARGETDLDLRNSRFRSAVADLAAPMHGVAKDELEGEDIRQHRRARRLARAGVSALALLVVISIGLGVVARASRNQAVVARNRAVSVGNTARAQALAAESLNELSADPLVSLLLARRAVKVSPIPQAVAALRHAIDASAVRLALPTESAKRCAFQTRPALAYSPTAHRIAESLCDGDVVMHASATGKVVSRQHVAVRTGALAYSANGRRLAVGTENGIDLLDPSTGHITSRLRGHGEPNALAFGPDGSMLAATTPLGATLWDLKSGTARFSLEDPDRDRTVAFTSDGRSLVVGTIGLTNVVDVTGGRIVRELSPPGQVPGQANDGSFNPIALVGRRLVVGENVTARGGVSAAIDLWDTDTWTMQRVLTEVTGTEVASVAISPDGNKVAIGNADGTGGVWSESPDEQLVALAGQTATIGTIAFSPTGNEVAAASTDGTARIYRATGPWLSTQTAVLCGVCGREIGWQPRQVVALARSRNDTHLRSWLQPAGRMLADRVVGAGQQDQVGTLSRDGTLAALWNASAHPTTVRVIDTATGRLAFAVPAPSIEGVTFSDDDRLLVADDDDGNLYVSTVSDGHTIVHHGWSEQCGGSLLEISPDDRIVAVQTFHDQVCVGPTDSATRVAVYTRPGQLSSAAFNPAGNRLALGFSDSTVTVLNVATKKPVLQLVGHTRGVTGVAYSPDGRYIATTSADNTTRIWDATTGQLMQTDRDNATTAMPSFSPDSQMVAETNSDGQLRVWSVCVDCHDPAALFAASESALISPLTPLEQALEQQFSNPPETVTAGALPGQS